jgi:GYF domain 2
MPIVVDIAADLAVAEYWYVYAGELTYGPFTPAQMESLAEQGRLANDTMIAPAGGGEWQLASQLIRVQNDAPTPEEVAAMVGLQPDADDAALPSYENAHPEHVLDEIGLRNQAALSQRSSDEPVFIKPVRVEDIDFIAPSKGVVLPAVCPRCGVVGTEKRLERYRKSADWLLIFAFFTIVPAWSFLLGYWYLRFLGLGPYLVMSALFGKRGSITMFTCEACAKRVRVRKLSGFVLLGITALCCAAAISRNTPLLFALAGPLGIVGASFAMDKILRVKRAVKREGKIEFRFSRGHTRFLVAVNQMDPHTMNLIS